MTTPNYVSYPYIMSSKGLVARYAIDRLPDHTYWNFNDAECRQENSISSRLGRHVITQNGTVNLPLPDNRVHTLPRLKGLFGVNYRYAGANQNLYRRVGDSDGAYTGVPAPGGLSPFSGDRFAYATYRPNNSSFPYIFFADAVDMLKDNGTFATLQQWGIFAPTVPPTVTLEQYNTTIVDDFTGAPGSFTFSNITGTSQTARLSTTLNSNITGAPGYLTGVLTAGAGVVVPQILLAVGAEKDISAAAVRINPGPGSGRPAVTAFYQNSHLAGEAVTSGSIQGSVAAATTAYVQKTGLTLNLSLVGGLTATPSSSINVAIMADSRCTITILFDVSDGTFTNSYYTAPVTGNFTVGSFKEVAIPQSAFTAVGAAGQPGNTWANVVAWRIQVVTPAAVTSVVGFSDLYLYGGTGPTSFGGVPYDYRITYYNINTGDESGPSVVFQPQNFITPNSQSVLITWSAPLDPQVTHVRVYRRGGTLPNQWLQVAQVPVGTTSFTDTLTDQQIAVNNILNVDTAPPITSTLPVPVNTTTTAAINITVGSPGAILDIGVASVANMFTDQVLLVDPLTVNEEIVIIQSIDRLGNTVRAFFQNSHPAGTVLSATTETGAAANIMTIAFDRAWIAGDPNNPGILYYSDRFNPESFPLENFLEIGTPSDPIMAVVEWNGQLYVFTQTTVWNILGAQGGGVPVPYKTAANHGLQARNGWTIVEGQIWYQSFGGIYAFDGAVSRYMSEPIEWIFTGQLSESPSVAVWPLVAMVPSLISQTLMSYFQNEIYIAYAGVDGQRHRVIYHQIYKRWRNDDVPANAMATEDDTYTLLFGDFNGMIYQDRTGNYDDNGPGIAPAPIRFNVQTAAMDLNLPKNFKVFNEFTLDIDTGGNTVNITLVYDNGTTFISLGTVNSFSRQQFQYNVNTGLGQLSLNVSLLLQATIASLTNGPIIVYEAHIRATPEAELRRSFDSYLMDFGSPDYKMVKQGWFEYTALDPGGITFSCYLEGSLVPNFSFTLPQSLPRVSKRVRFPATKGRVWRWTATSAGDFRLYSDSRLEWKPVTLDKGYDLRPLQMEAPAQP